MLFNAYTQTTTERLQQDCIQKFSVILYNDLQCESHRLCSPPSSVTC